MTANTPPTDRSFWRAHKATRERLRDCGYEYLVIDNRPRSKTGNTYGKSVPSSEKFATESNIHQISGVLKEISLTPKAAQDPQAIHSLPQELNGDSATYF